MSSIISESDTYDASIVTPETSDTDYPSTVKTGRTSLANRTNFLIRRLRGQGDTESLSEALASAAEPDIVVPSDAIMGGGNVLKAAFTAVASRIKQIKTKAYGGSGQVWHVLVPPVPSYYDPAEFSVVVASDVVFVTQDDTTGPSTFWLNATVPLLTPYATLTQVTAFVQGVSHSALPTNKPVVTVHRIHTFGSVAASVGFQQDTSASAVNYDTAHEINVTVSQLMSLGTNQIGIRFQGEYGADTAGLKIYGFRLTFTPS